MRYASPTKSTTSTKTSRVFIASFILDLSSLISSLRSLRFVLYHNLLPFPPPLRPTIAYLME